MGNYIVSLVIVAFVAVVVLGWQNHRTTRKIIIKLDVARTLDELIKLDELPATLPPDLRLIDPDETAPPPCPAGSWSVGRKLAVVGSLSAVMFAAMVATLHELPPQAAGQAPPVAAPSAPAASVVTDLSLATTSQRQDVHGQPSTTTTSTSSLDAARTTMPNAPVAAPPNPAPTAPPLVAVPSTPLVVVPTSIITTAPRVDLSTVQQVPPVPVPAPTSAAKPPHEQNADEPKPKSSLLSNAVSSVLGLITLG